MNTNLLNIMKQITAQYGEGILGDAARLKGMVNDLAKAEPKEDRVAFGRAVEQGFYHELKRAAPHERAGVKAALTSRLQSVTGFDAPCCAAAVNLLEAAMTASAPPAYQQYQQAPPPNANWGGAAPSGGAPAFGPQNARGMGGISRKSLIFGAAAGAGALAGELVSELLGREISFSHALGIHVLEVAFWSGILSLGISIALIAAQHLLQRKRPDFKSLLPPVLLGILTGTAAGSIAQVIFNVTQDISPLVKTTSNALCWGIFGAGLGFGVSLFIPNYPKNRAMLAGLAGGTLGGAIYVALLSSGTNAGGYIGVMVLGLVIGLAISIVEEALREAWLTVIWGPKESVTISLGAKPVVFGSSREADIYLPARGGAPALPVRAVVTFENGQVVLDDKQTGKRGALSNGGEFTLDRLRVVVNTKA